MNSEETAAALLPAFQELIGKFPQSDVSDVCSALTIACLNALRLLDGDQFVIDFLEAAIKDARTSPPLPVMTEVYQPTATEVH